MPSSENRSTISSRLAAATTSNSQASLKWLKQHGVPSRKLHFIGNALDPAIADRTPSTPKARAALLASLGLDPSRPPIVALGRFDAYKNQDGLVRALIRVRDRWPQALPPLLLAGFLEDQARVANVQKLADAAKLEIRIVPPVTDVATLLEAARFSVLASRSEGTPNVVLEALGLGTLVVATRVGEVTSLATDAQTAILCDAGDDAALAAALERALLIDPHEAIAMGQRARFDMLARYSPTAVTGQYNALYHAILRQ